MTPAYTTTLQLDPKSSYKPNRGTRVYYNGALYVVVDYIKDYKGTVKTVQLSKCRTDGTYQYYVLSSGQSGKYTICYQDTRKFLSYNGDKPSRVAPSKKKTPEVVQVGEWNVL